jgi:hypothetical protein
VLSDSAPGAGFERVEANLEDVYFAALRRALPESSVAMPAAAATATGGVA